MILRWTSLFLLIYIYWNRSDYDIIANNNSLSIAITKLFKLIPLLPFSIIVISILFIMFTLYKEYKITTYIIAWIIIMSTLALSINILILNEVTDIIIFQVSHPLSEYDKMNYLASYLSQSANNHSIKLTTSEQQYFEFLLQKCYTKINASDISKMTLNEIEAYCDKVVAEAAHLVCYQHNKITYITFIAALIISLPIIIPKLLDFIWH